MTIEDAIAEDLIIRVGIGVTKCVGSDRYPFYVSEVLEKGVVGLYRPNSHFKKDWTDGDKVVDQFDPNKTSEFYIKRRYGNWWKCEKNGKPLGKWSGRYIGIHFGQAVSYRDPNF